MNKNDHLYLVDGSTYIFRAYHALPPLTRKSDGLPVGAVNGFCSMLNKLIREMKGDEAPTHLAVIFDHSGKSFRNEFYPDYKAHRPPPPEDLVPQFALIRDAVRAFNVPCIEQENYEADDLIATYACQAAKAGADVTIVSTDKDLMQLVNGNIRMLDTMKNNRIIGADEVIEKFGVGPDKVIEVQSLAGDSVDNVPGVPGIGVKTAAQLIEEYGDLETLLERADEIKQNKRRENLIEFADQARISKRLVTLDQNVPVDVPIDDFQIVEPDPKELIGFLMGMEFRTLTNRVAKDLEIDNPQDFAPDIDPAEDVPAAKPKAAKSDAAKASSGTAQTGAPSSIPRVDTKIDPSTYDMVTSQEALDAWIDKIWDAGQVTIDTETNSLDAVRADLVGISLSVVPGEACYIPLQHGKLQEPSLDLEGAGPPPEQLPLKDVIKALKPVLESDDVLKIGQNIKYDLIVLQRHGARLHPVDDTMLLSYVLNSGLHKHNMDDLSDTYLGHRPIAFKDVAGSGKKALTFDQVPVAAATKYAAEDADVTGRLHRIFKPRLWRDKKTTVYETLERPLIPVLADMEQAGIKVDPAILRRKSSDFEQRMAGLEAEAHDLAGEKFNLGSPKQLGEILFEKMSLDGGKKTKTGAYGTGADVLEQLAAMGHDLPKVVLDWRQLSKLKSTYTDALVDYINPGTGRIHTSFAMASTSTGRLSSSDPNLQNIPIRSDEGRAIRTAFIAEKGNKLVSADYSQIELRVLAHIANIDALKQAFADGLDIHAMTASEIFGVPIKDMDPMVRRKAKAINFGIIYGISAFGLAANLGIARGEAQDYINAYFEKFPGIKAYMEDAKAYCKEHGYVETIFGRRMHMPEIKSKAHARRAFVERAAINAPIQGSAADIIRRAMIRIPPALKKAKLDARMLLQVHDELILEAPKEQVKKTCEVVREVMEHATQPALDFSVPLEVETGAADSWAEAH